MNHNPKYENHPPFKGKHIGNIVQDAIKGVSYSRNLEELRNNINITIREVTDLAKSGNPTKAPSAPKQQKSQAKAAPQPFDWKPSPPARFNSPSKALYTFMLVFGMLLASAFTVLFLVSLIASIRGMPFLAPLAGVSGFFLILSLILAFFSGSRSGKILKFQKYKKYIGNESFCSLEQMAKACMENISSTKNNVKKMIAAGWFPNGHIDYEETTLMLDEETYRMYLLAEDAKWQREAEKAAQKKEAPPPAATSGNAELDEAVREGRAYIREIRRANDAIPGEEISHKISQLETVTVKIFACVERRPEKLPDIRRFMSYYLPTTLKLLNAYQEFDSQTIQTPKIVSAKNQISGTLDTINQAFSSLMDTLYEDDILDIASDISVLETMFAQEGLTSSDDFHKNDSSQAT